MNTYSKLILHMISVLILTVILLLAAIPTPRAETYSTEATMSVSPNPAVVYNPFRINGTVTPAPPDGYFYSNVEFEILQPDGRVFTLGPFESDSNGTVYADHTPTQVGEYSVSFKIEQQTIAGNDYLESNYALIEFRVEMTAPDNDDDNMEPVAFFTFSPAAPEINETVTFDASASIDPDGSITDYFWDFGDGTTGTGVTATHTYASNGSYTVFLTVTDDDGLTDDTSRTINEVIPEFPSMIIIPLLLATTLLIIICKQKLPKNQASNHIRSLIEVHC